MEITIGVGELLFDIANKSHAELEAAVPDIERRYPFEAGTEKREEIFRLVTDAASLLHISLQRFTVDPPVYGGTGGDNTQQIDAGSCIVFRLADSSRRRAEQSESLAQLMHSWLASTVLSSFYSTRESKDADTSGVAAKLAAAHAARAAAALAGMTEYLYTKLRPVRSVRPQDAKGESL